MTPRGAPRTRALRFASGLFGLAVGAAFACGPSLKNVHEGTVRFEHCNRLDLDERIAKTECKKCWSTWLAEYTYGQPRDRIDYGRRRARALSNGDDGARPILKFDERNPEQRQFYLVVPGPTSVHAPPPPIATVWKDADAGTLAKVAADGPPAEVCADDCRSIWQSCTDSCGNGHAANGTSRTSGSGQGGGGKSGNGATKVDASGNVHGAGSASPGPNACTKCGSDYSTCMKRCFE